MRYQMSTDLRSSITPDAAANEYSQLNFVIKALISDIKLSLQQNMLINGSATGMN
jgi:hypothetical protein